MKQFINKLGLGAMILLLLTACSSKQEPQAPADTSPQQPAVQASLPPTNIQDKLQEVPAEQTSVSTTPVVKPVTSPKPAPKPVAAPTATKDYVTCFAAWDANLHTLQTAFTQSTEYDEIPISVSKGKLSYQQQGPKLRLDNLEGENISQTALTNKKTIHILDDKGKEISVVQWNDWLQGQPNQALFDFGNYTQLLKQHQVTTSQVNDKQTQLKLLPKNEKEEYVLYVTIDADTCFPTEIAIEAELMKTTALLSDTQVNQPLPTNLFKGLN